MPIKIFINGYYRSGTTFCWSFLKDCFLSDYVVYYEPLNPNLAEYINFEKRTKKSSNLHGKKLWQEYISLPFVKLNKILLRHPNLGGKGISYADLMMFLEEFNNMSSNVCLQTNRLHFHLTEVADKFQSKNIHIIRHPLDVYNSMVSASINSDNLIKYYLKKLLLNYTNFFSLKKEFIWINNTFGIPGLNTGSWRRRVYVNNFEKFIVVYTISNFYAIKSMKKDRTILLPYEFLMKKPEDAIEYISNFLDEKAKKVSLDEFKPKNIYNFKPNRLKRLKKIIHQYGLVEEWEQIELNLKDYSLSYLNNEN